MPIPAAPKDDSTPGVVLALFHQIHRQLRDEIEDLDADALNWEPTEGANSISTIITHLVGSEAETLRCVAGWSSERNRDAEFVGKRLTVREVRGIVDEADDLITEVGPHIDIERLRSVFALPTLPRQELRSGLTWLVGNYGHAQQHVGHIQLTRQLYEVRRLPASEGLP